MKNQSAMGDAELQMALRGLRHEVAPEHDLWPAIAERLAAQSQPASRPRRIGMLALAASMLLALGLAWQLRPMEMVMDAQHAAFSMQQDEATLLTLHYQAALREMDLREVPANWQPGMQALDRSAAQIRQALHEQPDSRLLLERLRQTYARRIALSRRALYV